MSNKLFERSNSLFEPTADVYALARLRDGLIFEAGDVPHTKTMTQKLDGIVSAMRGLKSQGVRELRAILTPSNLEVMLESYVPDLFGWNVRVITVDGFGDDEWLQHSVVVASNIEMDRRQLKPLSDLIGAVYPHHITEHLAPEELGPHYDGESNYVQFAAVTREYAKRWREKTIGLAGIAGTDGQSVTEDDVRRIDDFLVYCLCHDLHDARALALTRLQRRDSALRAFPIRQMGPADWARTAQTVHHDHGIPMEIVQKYGEWSTDLRRSMWPNLHGRLLTLSIVLAPLELVPYAMLWVLDYLRPMSFRCYDRARGGFYDPNHRHKLRLFEGVSASYARLRADN